MLSAFGSGADCALFSDALNHASIVDGARLAAKGSAELHVYRRALDLQSRLGIQVSGVGAMQ